MVDIVMLNALADTATAKPPPRGTVPDEAYTCYFLLSTCGPTDSSYRFVSLGKADPIIVK